MQTPNTIKQTGLRLPANLLFELRQRALEEERSLNSLAREALEDWLERHAGKNDADEFLKAVPSGKREREECL